MAQVAVMGAGSWGTTVAKVFADSGNPVTLWARREEVATDVNDNHRNSAYLGNIELPGHLRATTDPAEALAPAEIVVLGVPSQALRGNLQSWREHIGPDATIISLAKGIEYETGMRMSQVIADVAGVTSDRVAVLTGPNLAKEVALGQPAATLIACEDGERARFVQSAVAAPYFRPYTSQDVLGAEVAGTSSCSRTLSCPRGPEPGQR